MKIKEVMTKDIRLSDTDTPVQEVARMMKDRDCGSIPVGKGDRLQGMVTDRDIVLRCVAEGKDPAAMRAAECMSPGILYCNADDDVEDVLRTMGEEAVQRLPVVDADKQLCGIVSLSDLVRACEDKFLCGQTLDHIKTATARRAAA